MPSPLVSVEDPWQNPYAVGLLALCSKAVSDYEEKSLYTIVVTIYYSFFKIN